MPRLDVQIPAPDGHSHGTLHVPDGDGPWPGVLVFPDAGGARETFGQMGDRLAGLGYVALIPDIYYRAGEWTPFDMATLFTDPRERARMSGLARALTWALSLDARATRALERRGIDLPGLSTWALARRKETTFQ